MPYDVVMPQLGMTMTEGSVVKWFKESGEAVEKGELLFIVQTDKVDIEIESPRSGILTKPLVDLNQIVPVGTVICRITDGEPVEFVALSQETPLSTSPAEQPAKLASCSKGVFSPRSDERTLANPRAKKVAHDLGIDISLVPDYEQRGRIVEADVRRFFLESSAARSTSPINPQVVSVNAKGDEPSFAARKSVADRMTLSFQTTPHFYLTALADATELVSIKEGLIESIQAQIGVRLSYTDLLLKILATALYIHPEINAQWQGTVVPRKYISLGFAVQSSDRLIVPVIRNADKLPLAELAKERSALVARARDGKLQLEEVGDASCTLSNLGFYRVDFFNAIINPPESVILATGRIAPRPLVIDGTIVPRQTIHLSLAVDHRLIDGSTAAGFLSSLVRMVESPDLLLKS